MQNKPNLLFVFADQWRRQAMGCAGQDPVHTPNMDKFAQEALYCTNAVSCYPLCSPHRASLLTGRHPLATGVYTNCKPGLPVRLPDEEIGIAQVLKEQGYQTGYIGKWHLDEPEINHSEAPASGARDWDAYTPPGVRRHGFDNWYSYGTYDQHLTPHYWKDSPEIIQINEWSPRHETSVAIEALARRDRNKPFALFLSWNPPHSPYNLVPEEYLALYQDKEIPLRGNVQLNSLHHHTYEPVNYTPDEFMQVTREYFAAVSGLDDQFGRLLQALDEQGLRDNTLLVLSADHGDMMGSHGMMAKHVWYEESVGIPCVMRGPGLPVGRCGTVIGSPDFAPTLLSLMGIQPPACMQGVDCSPSLRSAATQEDKAAYMAACPGGLHLLEKLRAAGKNPLHFGWRALRTPRYSYVLDVGYNPQPVLQRMLYDLETDPLQLNPLCLENPAAHPVAAEMEARLAAWMHEQQDGFLGHLRN